MTGDPFERNRILSEAHDKRAKAAEATIRGADIERLTKVLAHLPLLDAQRYNLGNAAWRICFTIELARQEAAESHELLPSRATIRPDARKPLAAAGY
jgi:hypothetical protein